MDEPCYVPITLHCSHMFKIGEIYNVPITLDSVAMH